MTKTNSTKKALLSSAFALLICVAMLIGTTFAWFTDTASTAVNKIQAGTLKVDIVDMQYNSLKNQQLKWQAEDGREQADILWEPGCTYYLEPFMIQNKGNLALKYKVIVNGVTGDNKLLEALDFGFYYLRPGFGAARSLDELVEGEKLDNVSEHPGITTLPIYIYAHMKETAGNEYQGLSIEGVGITVYATQDTYEKDSTGDRYDEAAEYDKKTIYNVDTVKALKTAAANAKKGDEIVLSNDLTLSETVRFAASGITFDGNGHTITAEMTDTQVEDLTTLLSFGYGTTYCSGVTVKNVSFNGKGGRAMHFHGGSVSLLENVKISGEWSLAINFHGTHGAVMNNCDISSTYANKYAKGTIFANEQSANQIVLNNTKIDSIFVNATEKGATYANNGIKLIVNSGSVVNEIHTNIGVARTFHTVNGGNVGSLLADVE